MDELSAPTQPAEFSAGSRTTPDDILIFLPGEREIRETAEALRKHPLKPAHKVDVIPLYARLSSDEQLLTSLVLTLCGTGSSSRAA